MLELMVVVAILGLMAAILLSRLDDIRENAYQTAALAEIKSFSAALETYITLNGTYPPDANRGIPSGLESYLSGDGWPDGPWPGSVYDWDAWEIDGESVYQLSVRFCPAGGPLSACRFPDTEWAENFEVQSSVFYCYSGDCRSHVSRPVNHPGYCVNCVCKEMEDC
jgi:type II secretory pathway pseudopilin PulG